MVASEKVRYEMKNHMANIKGLAGAGQYGEIEKYVRQMDETMQELEYKYVTGNPGIRFRSHPEQAFG